MRRAAETVEFVLAAFGAGAAVGLLALWVSLSWKETRR